MLRARIQELLESHSDPKEGAIQVCLLLEDLMDIEGNGWFDGDEELLGRLEANWNQDSAETNERLDALVDELLREGQG